MVFAIISRLRLDDTWRAVVVIDGLVLGMSERCCERSPHQAGIACGYESGWFALWIAYEQVATVTHHRYQHCLGTRDTRPDAMDETTPALAVTVTRGSGVRAWFAHVPAFVLV